MLRPCATWCPCDSWRFTEPLLSLPMCVHCAPCSYYKPETRGLDYEVSSMMGVGVPKSAAILQRAVHRGSLQAEGIAFLTRRNSSSMDRHLCAVLTAGPDRRPEGRSRGRSGHPARVSATGWTSRAPSPLQMPRHQCCAAAAAAAVRAAASSGLKCMCQGVAWASHLSSPPFALSSPLWLLPFATGLSHFSCAHNPTGERPAVDALWRPGSRLPAAASCCCVRCI